MGHNWELMNHSFTVKLFKRGSCSPFFYPNVTVLDHIYKNRPPFSIRRPTLKFVMETPVYSIQCMMILILRKKTEDFSTLSIIILVYIINII